MLEPSTPIRGEWALYLLTIMRLASAGRPVSVLAGSNSREAAVSLQPALLP